VPPAGIEPAHAV